MRTSDLERYKKLLLEKQRELLFVKPDAETRVPRAGGPEGDLVDQANADAEAQCRSACTKPTGGFCGPSKTHSRG
jgi:hypothetical protein